MRASRLTINMTAGLVAVLAVLLSGCSSAVPTDTPGVEQLGENIMRHTAPELETVVGYRYAAGNLGSEWLILEIAISSPHGQSAKIEREKVFVKTPSGATIPLAGQREFGEAYSGLRATLRAADVAREPMDYFPPSREECAIQFFAAPGASVAFDEVSVNDRRTCQGRFFFRVPGGVQKGRWVLGIDLEESAVRLPFTM